MTDGSMQKVIDRIEDPQANVDILRFLKNMYPGYFTLTMATGIISIGTNLLNIRAISQLMYVLALLSWGGLFGVYTWRLLRFPRAVLDDLMNPRKTFSFFSFVAATDVVGLLLNTHGHEYLAVLCWGVAFAVWAGLLYCTFSVLTFMHGERNINIVDGGWLIAIVGTQSLVLLGLKLVHLSGEYAGFAMLGIYMLWWLGLFLYGVFVTLFCYRLFFLEMSLEDYSPLMWVIMGAAAISANASSTLDMSDPVITVLSEIHPVVDGVALLTWTLATWWIPLLVVIGIWKHVVRRVPLSYDPRQWSIVFPLGMYTVATIQLSLAAEFEPMHEISHVMVWVAILVWCLLIAGLATRFINWLALVRTQGG
jgi:tellurite resistance protein TehA-like permease